MAASKKSDMDISLKELSNSDSEFLFPSLPEKIQIKGSAKQQSYDIIGVGTVKIPKGTEAGTISWSGTFFGSSKKNEQIIRKGRWKAPKTCVSRLEKWRDKGKVLRLLVGGTSINYDVTIQSFDGEEYGAHGNYNYTITFARYQDLQVFTTDELKIAAYKPVTRPAAKTGAVYTVVKGDCLWKIAQKKLGKATRWTEIYSLNKDSIEATAKKYGRSSSSNGHWIYPGQKLTLPAK